MGGGWRLPCANQYLPQVNTAEAGDGGRSRPRRACSCADGIQAILRAPLWSCPDFGGLVACHSRRRERRRRLGVAFGRRRHRNRAVQSGGAVCGRGGTRAPFGPCFLASSFRSGGKQLFAELTSENGKARGGPRLLGASRIVPGDGLSIPELPLLRSVCRGLPLGRKLPCRIRIVIVIVIVSAGAILH